MEFQFIYSNKSITIYFEPAQNTQEMLLKIFENLNTRFLIYFQGTRIQYLDDFSITLSLDNIASNFVSPIFVKVLDGTQNMKNFVPVEQNFNPRLIKSSRFFNISASGSLVECAKKEKIENDDDEPPALVFAAPQKELKKKISMKEVKKHYKRNDCWIVIENQVYDITNYIKRHPGGDIILKAAGNDGTAYHYQYHPYLNIQSLLRACHLGAVSYP